MADTLTEPTTNSGMNGDDLERWVNECAEMTRPDRIRWCDGSQAEYDSLVGEMLRDGSLIELNQQTYPGCYLHRSDPTDVARTEKVTYICTPTQEDAGVTNNWMTPDDARTLLTPLFRGAMEGRTMYMIPYLMGAPGSPFTIAGVEITDSPYVVISMRTMTRMGTVALDHIRQTGRFIHKKA
jgi:phosphoenolpyruvate carboxykinase (GTP)